MCRAYKVRGGRIHETVSHDTQVKQEAELSEIIEAPEHIWMHVYADADCWCSYHFDKRDDPQLLTEYVRADLLATARKEAFKEAQAAIRQVNIRSGKYSNRYVSPTVVKNRAESAVAALEASANSEKGEVNG